jgi:hypothetical protein
LEVNAMAIRSLLHPEKSKKSLPAVEVKGEAQK